MKFIARKLLSLVVGLLAVIALAIFMLIDWLKLPPPPKAVDNFLNKMERWYENMQRALGADD